VVIGTNCIGSYKSIYNTINDHDGPKYETVKYESYILTQPLTRETFTLYRISFVLFFACFLSFFVLRSFVVFYKLRKDTKRVFRRTHTKKTNKRPHRPQNTIELKKKIEKREPHQQSEVNSYALIG